MSAEAWPCLSLTCCVTLGKFLDLSEPEDPGVGEGRPQARMLWATGTVTHCRFLGSHRHSGARLAAAPLGMGTLSHKVPPRSLQKPGVIWAEERLKMPRLETGGCRARVLVVGGLPPGSVRAADL